MHFSRICPEFQLVAYRLRPCIHQQSRAGQRLGGEVENKSRYVTSNGSSEVVTDTVLRLVLQLESLVVNENNKWRFFDGQQSFHALIEDKSFLARVDAGEPFRKGDVIVADVRISQQQSGWRLSAERVITRVHDRRTRSSRGTDTVICATILVRSL